VNWNDNHYHSVLACGSGFLAAGQVIPLGQAILCSLSNPW